MFKIYVNLVKFNCVGFSLKCMPFLESTTWTKRKFLELYSNYNC